jgi:hypothetical protein
MKLWNRYGFTSPEDLVLEDLAFALGVVVLEGRLDSADARLIRKGDKGLIRVKQDIPEPGRKRFAIAHEVGHWLLHATLSQVLSCTSEDMVDRYKSSAPELEANAFAAELLMPQLLFRKRVGTRAPSPQLLKDLADYFRTTLTATVVRFVEVEEEGCAMVVTENGRIRWWKANERFEGFWLDAQSEVSPNTVAGAFLKGEPTPEEAEEVDGEAWLGSKARRVAESLYEVAIPLGRYGQVISLVWPA